MGPGPACCGVSRESGLGPRRQGRLSAPRERPFRIAARGVDRDGWRPHVSRDVVTSRWALWGGRGACGRSAQTCPSRWTPRSGVCGSRGGGAAPRTDAGREQGAASSGAAWRARSVFTRARSRLSVDPKPSVFGRQRSSAAKGPGGAPPSPRCPRGRAAVTVRVSPAGLLRHGHSRRRLDGHPAAWRWQCRFPEDLERI